MQLAAQDREVFLNYQLLTIFLLVLFLLVLFFVRHKQSNNSDKEATQANKAHMHQKAAINLPLIQPPLRMETTGLRKSTRQFPMRIIKIGNGAEAAQAMLRLLFLHKKSIH